jgi:hypothetical protein
VNVLLDCLASEHAGSRRDRTHAPQAAAHAAGAL